MNRYNDSWYINSNGIKHAIVSSTYVNVYNLDIVELYLKEGVKILDCSYNKISKLHLPLTLETLNCDSNELTSLKLPDNIQDVCCGNNKLNELVMNEKLIICKCCYNKHLEYLTANDRLFMLTCDYKVKITNIKLFNNLKNNLIYE